MAARFDRIQAANEAVDACLRASGTRDYQAAFLHVQATRPELFADMHDPSGSVAAANFNPYHDPMGKLRPAMERWPRTAGSTTSTASGPRNARARVRPDIQRLKERNMMANSRRVLINRRSVPVIVCPP